MKWYKVSFLDENEALPAERYLVQANDFTGAVKAAREKSGNTSLSVICREYPPDADGRWIIVNAPANEVATQIRTVPHEATLVDSEEN